MMSNFPIIQMTQTSLVPYNAVRVGPAVRVPYQYPLDSFSRCFFSSSLPLPRLSFTVTCIFHSADPSELFYTEGLKITSIRFLLGRHRAQPSVLPPAFYLHGLRFWSNSTIYDETNTLRTHLHLISRPYNLYIQRAETWYPQETNI
jgi:hypothetical protein